MNLEYIMTKESYIAEMNKLNFDIQVCWMKINAMINKAKKPQLLLPSPKNEKQYGTAQKEKP